MKQFRFITLFAVSVLLILSSCNKDDNKEPNASSGFRIIAEKSYSSNAIDYTTNYLYTNNKLTKATSADEWSQQEIVFTYPDENNITATVTDGQTSFVATITLVNNKVDEFTVPGDWKDTYSYNSDGTVAEQSSYYFEDTGWVLNYTITSSYNGGKMTEFIYSGDDGLGVMITYAKSEISYNGNEVNEIVTSFFDGELWYPMQKSVYMHQAGNNIKITEYYTQDGTTFEVDSYTDFTYDENNNLIGRAEDGENDFRTEYEYEPGTGNFGLIFGTSDYSMFEPRPVKKSGKFSANFVNSRGQINMAALFKTHGAL